MPRPYRRGHLPAPLPLSPSKRTFVIAFAMSPKCRFCSLIPGLGVKLSTIILAGPTVLSAVDTVIAVNQHFD
jgi:hypothetical protein